MTRTLRSFAPPPRSALGQSRVLVDVAFDTHRTDWYAFPLTPSALPLIVPCVLHGIVSVSLLRGELLAWRRVSNMHRSLNRRQLRRGSPSNLEANYQ